MRNMGKVKGIIYNDGERSSFITNRALVLWAPLFPVSRKAIVVLTSVVAVEFQWTSGVPSTADATSWH